MALYIDIILSMVKTTLNFYVSLNIGIWKYCNIFRCLTTHFYGLYFETSIKLYMVSKDANPKQKKKALLLLKVASFTRLSHTNRNLKTALTTTHNHHRKPNNHTSVDE